MPYRLVEVEPEIAIEHAGVTVWRTYRNDDIGWPSDYWFTTNKDHRESDGDDFDVRTLPTWPASVPRDELADTVAAVLRAAIDAGLITATGLTGRA